MLTRIVYTSRLSPALGEAEITELIAAAAEFNAAHLITGVIAIESGRVCQVLEGEKAVVDSLYDRIAGDPRHNAVGLLVDALIEDRHFTEWGMVRTAMIDIVTFALSISNDLEPA